MKYKLEEVWLSFSENMLDRDFDFHQLMLNDKIRMNAYKKSIKKAVKNGMTVLDLGCGTGVLALWALEAGAKKVYGIDMDSDILNKAINNIKLSVHSEKFIPYNGLSYDIDLPEKVDIIVSEILGNIGDNENMVAILKDAKKRFLKKTGKMLPKMVTTYIVPVSSESANKQIYNREYKNLNLKYKLDNLLSRLGLNSMYDIYYDCIIPKSKNLSIPKVVNKILFNNKDKEIYSKKISYIVNKKSIFTGFKGYFVAELFEGVFLDISGDEIGKNTSDSWKHCYMPIENTIEVNKGDIIKLVFSRSLPIGKQSVFSKIYTREGSVIRSNKIILKFKQTMGS